MVNKRLTMRLLGILEHQALELRLGLLMLEVRVPRADEDIRELRPGIGGAHIDNSERLNARPRRVDPEQGRGLAALDAAPELAFGGHNEVLIKWIGITSDLDPFAPAGYHRQHG